MKRWNVLAMISPMSAQRVAGIAQFAKERGWNLLYLDRLGSNAAVWSGDGVLATIRDDPATVSQVRQFLRRGIPVVDLAANRPDIRVPRVASDHAAIGKLAGKHFAEHHYRNFAWFSTSWGNVHEMRFRAFAKSCATQPERWVAADGLPVRGSKWLAFNRWIKTRLSAAPKPLAVLCYDETDAARLLYAAQDLGVSVPEEMAILSIGNAELICENQTVPISSIDQNLFRGGYEAAALLEQLMSRRPSHRAKAKTVLVPPAGVVTRRSTDAVAIADPIVRNALLYIDTRIARPIGAPQIAEHLGIPRHVLDAHFRLVLNRSVGEEIRRMRLAKARHLLRNTQTPVGIIARQVGYCTPAHLSNVFRAACGTSPRAWRAAHR